MVVFPVLAAPLTPGASVAVRHAEAVKRMPIHVKHVTGRSSKVRSDHAGPCEEPGTVVGVPTPLHKGHLEVTPGRCMGNEDRYHLTPRSRHIRYL